MKIKILLVVMVACLAAIPVWAQNFSTSPGDDTPQSFGQFWILIDPAYQSQFAGCPAYNTTTHVLQSPILYEPHTVIGRSARLKDGGPGDASGVSTGLAGVTIKDGVPPPGFAKVPGQNEVHTELHKLNMATYGGGPMARVRAGVCYSSTACSSAPPANRVSMGEVISNNPTPGASPDFPARSYFDVFAQIDVPACGSFPGGTVFNSKPLFVQAPSISSFPPSGVVYLHDTSSVVGVKFLPGTAPGGHHGGKGGDHGEKHDRLGCIILAGHGIIPTFPIRRVGESQQSTPLEVQVALQKPAPERVEKMRPPTKAERDREAKAFGEHMRQEHERGGNKHTDCGPEDKDND